MNNKRIGKFAVTAIVGVLSAISGIVGVEMMKSVKKDSPEFDKAYDDFTKLMTDLKTDKYNPSECALGVLSAVRLMNEDTSMDFEAALHSSTTVTTAKKFFNNIKKTDNNKIVKAAKEVVKYDN